MAASFSIQNLSQNNITIGLFLLLALIAYVNPSIVTHLNSTILGRLVTVIIIIFFASKNMVIGLLATLIVIAIMQTTIYQAGIEGNRGMRIKNKDKLTCNDGYTLLKGKCNPDGSEHGCTKGKYQYCKAVRRKRVSQFAAGPAVNPDEGSDGAAAGPAAGPAAVNPDEAPEASEAPETPEAFQPLGFSEYNTGDQLSNDLSRKAKRSNELVGVSTKSGSDDSVQPSEEVKESFKLGYSYF